MYVCMGRCMYISSHDIWYTKKREAEMDSCARIRIDLFSSLLDFSDACGLCTAEPPDGHLLFRGPSLASIPFIIKHVITFIRWFLFSSTLCSTYSLLHLSLLAKVGCGSGAIVLSLLHEIPHARGHAIDISSAAVNLTQRNAHKLVKKEKKSGGAIKMEKGKAVA